MSKDLPANVRGLFDAAWAIKKESIDFTFRDHMGQMQRGASAPMPAWQALEWKEGDKGIVRFDPDRPVDSVWVGEEAERTSR